MTAPDPLELTDADHDRIRLRAPDPADLALWPGDQLPIAILDVAQGVTGPASQVWLDEFAIDSDAARRLADWLDQALTEHPTSQPHTDDDALDVVRQHLEAIVPNAPAGARLHVLANLAHARIAALKRTLHVHAELNMPTPGRTAQPYTDDELARGQNDTRDRVITAFLAADELETRLDHLETRLDAVDLGLVELKRGIAREGT